MSNQTLTAWVVDSDYTTLLCNTNHTKTDIALTPATFVLSCDILKCLSSYQYATLLDDKLHLPSTYDKSILTASHPKIVIELNALVQLGIIKSEGMHYRQNGHTYICTAYRDLISSLDHDQVMIASHALQLLRWRRDHRYCSRCGTYVYNHSSEYALICPKCHYRSYPRVQPCVITAITRPHHNTVQILLALHHRHHKTGSDMHGLIAGFVEVGESLETAVKRETQEETGLMVDNIRYISSQAWPYPSNLMVGFIADYAAGEIMVDSQELVYAKFFDLDNLPPIPQVGTIARTLIDYVIYNHTTT